MTASDFAGRDAATRAYRGLTALWGLSAQRHARASMVEAASPMTAIPRTRRGRREGNLDTTAVHFLGGRLRKPQTLSDLDSFMRQR